LAKSSCGRSIANHKIGFFRKNRKRKNPDQNTHLGLIFRKQTNKKAKLGYSLELVFDIAHSKSPQYA
jgi:hypothetical protein